MNMILIACFCGVVGEDRLLLRDGMELRGRVTLEQDHVVLDHGPRTLFFSTRLLLKPAAGPTRTEELRIKLDQPSRPRGAPLDGIQSIAAVEAFDAFGRRKIRVRDRGGHEHDLVQSIVALTPTAAYLETSPRSWRTAIWLQDIPSNQLLPILEHALGRDPGGQLRTIGFLIAANRTRDAQELLSSFREAHPERASESQEIGVLLHEQTRQWLLAWAERAANAGQRQFLTEIPALLRGLGPTDTELGTIAAMQARLNESDALLQEAQNAIENRRSRADWGGDQDLVEALITRILSHLSPATLPRLMPMLERARSAPEDVAEALALGLSGWVVGPTLATDDPEKAVLEVRLAQLLQAAIEAPSEGEFQTAVRQLERVKPDPRLLIEMISLLPRVRFTVDPKAGPMEFQARAPLDARPINYQVVLPVEYDPNHNYPAMLLLADEGEKPEEVLQTWRQMANEWGIILVAPNWQPEGGVYRFSAEEHETILSVLADARRRFAIDANRVVLAGKGAGGVATWDVGLSHPDQFAALAPFAAAPLFYAQRYRDHLAYLAAYATASTMNPGITDQLHQEFAHYFRSGRDAILAEYPGGGPSNFVGELPTVIDFSLRKRRQPAPNEFIVSACRLSDRRFFWVEVDSFLTTATVPPELFHTKPFRPAKISARITDRNTILVRTSGIDQLSVLIMPRLVDWDDPKLEIKTNRRTLHRGPIEPDIRLMLEELRRTGDREALIIARIRANRL